MDEDTAANDGAAFFAETELHAGVYDLLYGSGAARFEDLAYYEGLASLHDRPRVLDAACGTGRVCCHLAGRSRSITGFDASRRLLEVARSRAGSLSADPPLRLMEGRLDDFALGDRYDLILIAYYGFSYVLDPDARRACLACVAAHLAPGGTVVVHLPASDLLSRPVPEHERAAMTRRMTFTARGGAPSGYLEYAVEAMVFDPVTHVRSVHSCLTLTDGSGTERRRERAVMRYAAIDEAEIRGLAEQAGLKLRHVAPDFGNGIGTELVAVLEHA